MPLPSGGGGGGINLGGAPLSVPNIGMGGIDIGSFVNAAQGTPLQQMLAGLAALPGITMQAQSQMADAQTHRLQMQDYQQKIAQNQWDMGIAMLQKNNALAGSPAMVQKFAHLSSVLGYPLPMDSTGTRIDPSVYGTNFTDWIKDKDWQQRFFDATPDQRRAMLKMNNVFGAPEEAINMKPVLTSAEQSLATRANASAAESEERAQNMRDMEPYKEGLLTGQTAEAWGAARDKSEHADYLANQAALGWRKANDAVWEFKQKMQNNIDVAKLRIGGQLNVAAYKASVQAVLQAQKDARTGIDALNTAINGAYNAGVDQDKIDQMYDQRDQLQKQVDAAGAQVQYMQEQAPQLENQVHGRNVTAATGKQSTVTNTQSPRTQYSATNSAGKTIWLHEDGQWY